jgi:hypothetical protein
MIIFNKMQYILLLSLIYIVNCSNVYNNIYHLSKIRDYIFIHTHGYWLKTIDIHNGMCMNMNKYCDEYVYSDYIVNSFSDIPMFPDTMVEDILIDENDTKYINYFHKINNNHVTYIFIKSNMEIDNEYILKLHNSNILKLHKLVIDSMIHILNINCVEFNKDILYYNSIF